MRFAEVLDARLGGGVAVLYCDPMGRGSPREAGKPEGDDPMDGGVPREAGKPEGDDPMDGGVPREAGKPEGDDPMDGGVPREAGKPEGDDGLAEPAVPPPALRIDDFWIAPSDGVIISPQDIAAALAHRFPAPEVGALTQELDATLDLWMEEWADA